MIYKYILRKLSELPIKDELKQICIELLLSQSIKGRKSKKMATSKSGIIIKICLKLLKIIETIFDVEEIPSGTMLLQFVKSLTMEIYQTERIQIILIKIRTYLLNIRWIREKRESLQKLAIRLNLFLESLMASSFFQLISQDFYSQIERLFLEAIRLNLAEGKFQESFNFISICFQSFKRQFTTLAEMFTFEQRKVYNIMEKKVQLFSLLFKLQYAGKMLSSPQKSSQTIAVFSKYQKIINRVPVPYDKDSLLEHFQVQTSSKTKTQPVISDLISQKNNRLSIMSIESVNNSECRRISIRDSLLFIDDIQRKKSKILSIESVNHLTPLNLAQPRKASRFHHDHSHKSAISDINQPKKRLDRSQSEGAMISKTVLRDQRSNPSRSSKFRILKDAKGYAKLTKKSIIEPKKFNLVIRADNEAKQKLRTCDPLKGHSTLLQLHLNRRQVMKNGLFINVANLRL